MTPQLRQTDPVRPEELSALLDGEIADFSRVEQLKTQLERDPGLKAEYDAQRQIKLALGQFDANSFNAPEYMHTRVLGAISAHKRQPRLLRVPTWGAAVGAMVLFALGFGAATQIPAPAGTPQTFQTVNTAYPPGLLNASSTDMFDEFFVKDYVGPDNVPAEAEWLSDFIELSQEAHSVSKTMRMTNGVVSPDMSDAVLVVNRGE